MSQKEGNAAQQIYSMTLGCFRFIFLKIGSKRSEIRVCACNFLTFDDGDELQGSESDVSGTTPAPFQWQHLKASHMKGQRPACSESLNGNEAWPRLMLKTCYSMSFMVLQSVCVCVCVCVCARIYRTGIFNVQKTPVEDQVLDENFNMSKTTAGHVGETLPFAAPCALQHCR